MTGDTAPRQCAATGGRGDRCAREVVLSWTPGEFAASHDVYFGTDFDAVDKASRTDDRGVLVIGRTAASYDPKAVLELWPGVLARREVNAPPESGTRRVRSGASRPSRTCMRSPT